MLLCLPGLQQNTETVHFLPCLALIYERHGRF
jgi:hypothetical protein